MDKKESAEKELKSFYPKESNNSHSIAYLWARTIICEGPGCGCEIPLVRSFWLSKKGKNSVGLRLIVNRTNKTLTFQIIEKAKASDISDGTAIRGAAICPFCGYTNPVGSVRKQFKKKRGGATERKIISHSNK